MKSTNEKRVIPLWRDNPGHILPTFVGARLAADFNDDMLFEKRYEELLRTLHGLDVIPRPPLGPNPFEGNGDYTPAFAPERYSDPNPSGEVTFDYSNNDGNFAIGSGEYRFLTHWSSASDKSIHCYRSGDLASIALVGIKRAVEEVGDAAQYDTSSRTRTPEVGEFVVARNNKGYYVAMQIRNIIYKGRNGDQDSLTFAYWILSDRSSDFSKLRMF